MQEVCLLFERRGNQNHWRLVLPLCNFACLLSMSLSEGFPCSPSDSGVVQWSYSTNLPLWPSPVCLPVAAMKASQFPSCNMFFSAEYPDSLPIVSGNWHKPSDCQTTEVTCKGMGRILLICHRKA